MRRENLDYIQRIVPEEDVSKKIDNLPDERNSVLIEEKGDSKFIQYGNLKLNLSKQIDSVEEQNIVKLPEVYSPSNARDCDSLMASCLATINLLKREQQKPIQNRIFNVRLEKDSLEIPLVKDFFTRLTSFTGKVQKPDAQTLLKEEKKPTMEAQTLSGMLDVAKDLFNQEVHEPVIAEYGKLTDSQKMSEKHHSSFLTSTLFQLENVLMPLLQSYHDQATLYTELCYKNSNKSVPHSAPSVFVENEYSSDEENAKTTTIASHNELIARYSRKDIQNSSRHERQQSIDSCNKYLPNIANAIESIEQDLDALNRGKSLNLIPNIASGNDLINPTIQTLMTEIVKFADIVDTRKQNRMSLTPLDESLKLLTSSSAIMKAIRQRCESLIPSVKANFQRDYGKSSTITNTSQAHSILSDCLSKLKDLNTLMKQYKDKAVLEHSAATQNAIKRSEFTRC